MKNEELLDMFAMEIVRSCAASGQIGRGQHFAKNVYDLAEQILDARQGVLNQWVQDEKSISTLGLGSRVEKVLNAENIFNVRQLQNCSFADLLKTPNMGRKSATQVKFQMHLFGLKLQGEE
jgi:DNA-directed RNA polymerase alpha subunit